MGFEPTNFDTPIYEEKSLEPKKAFIISCEGENTEPEYFETIKDKLSEHINILIEIELVPKLSGSAPSNVLEDLQRYIEEKKEKYGYEQNYDEFWIVIDREKQETRKENILNILPVCESKDIKIALTNPVFEFWLLLHTVNNILSKYSADDLYKNIKISNSKRFLDKELSKTLGSYSKKAGKFPTDIISLKNIKMAIEQEKLFENRVEKIIDNLGSNIGQLVQKILNSHPPEKPINPR